VFPLADWALIWNTLFDKVLLAGAFLVLGYFANIWLERYRSQLAIDTEGAKLRLNRIGTLWEEMGAWEADVKGLFVMFAGEALTELRNAGVPGVPPESEGSLKAIMMIANMDIPLEVQDRVLATVMPLKEAHVAQGVKLWRDIDRYRFWLREDLYQAMKGYHLAVQAADASLGLSPEKISAGSAALDALTAHRQDVDSAIAHILNRPEREAKKRTKPK
jgi:hypothetical protein